MKIYNYDKDSKIFLGISDAQENPKHKGEYLMPPNSTTIAPPDVSKCEIQVFNGSFWDIVPDYRKMSVVNLETHEVSEINKIGELENGFMLYSDYLNSEEYAQYQEKLDKEEKYYNLLSQIKDLDNKRIRAICEPSVKDSETGETWLDYYNAQVAELRTLIQEVV